MAEHTCAVEGRAGCLRCMELAAEPPRSLHKVSPTEMSSFWKRETNQVRAICGETFSPEMETSIIQGPVCRICFAPIRGTTYAR